MCRSTIIGLLSGEKGIEKIKVSFWKLCFKYDASVKLFYWYDF